MPGPCVSSKPGETSVKWQLCCDMTAKMWWMVVRRCLLLLARGLGRDSDRHLGGQEGTAGRRGPWPHFSSLLDLRDTWTLVKGSQAWLAVGGDPSLSV